MPVCQSNRHFSRTPGRGRCAPRLESEHAFKPAPAPDSGRPVPPVPPAPPVPPRSNVSQLTLDFGPPPAAGFDNFAAGRNRECLQTLRALPTQLRSGIDPPSRSIYVWGPTGSGKSHLAAALRSSDCEGLLVVDDCQDLSTDAQEQLFHRFNAMAQARGQALVAFGDQPPPRLQLMPDLASRLGWGIVFGLEPLGDDDLVSAMRNAAQERGLPIGDEVLAYLLRHTRRDMASLKTVLDGLDRLSLEQQRPVSLSLLRDLLRTGATDEADRLPDRIT
jgi:DnaA family protein